MGSGSDSEPTYGFLTNHINTAVSKSKETSPNQDPKKRFSCTYSGCNLTYNRQWKLDRHICGHTNERPFKCHFEGCDKDYRSNSHLRRHISVSHAKTQNPLTFINCPYPDCFKMFSNKYSLKKHCKSHERTDVHKCSECELSFKKRNQLTSHGLIHTGSSLSCDVCNEKFSTKKELVNHQKKHRIYICDYEGCQVELHTWTALRKHFKLHHPKTYSCNNCKKVFKNKSVLREHVLSHMSVEDRNVIKCPYKHCPRFYFYNRNLLQHVRIAHNKTRHKCDVDACDKDFSTKSKLQQHKKSHEIPKESIVKKIPKARKSRKDKGTHKKSMAAKLSGILLPDEVDKNLAQNNLTPDVVASINSTTNVLLTEFRTEVNIEQENENASICMKEKTENPVSSYLFIVKNHFCKTL